MLPGHLHRICCRSNKMSSKWLTYWCEAWERLLGWKFRLRSPQQLDKITSTGHCNLLVINIRPRKGVDQSYLLIYFFTIHSYLHSGTKYRLWIGWNKTRLCPDTRTSCSSIEGPYTMSEVNFLSLDTRSLSVFFASDAWGLHIQMMQNELNHWLK